MPRPCEHMSDVAGSEAEKSASSIMMTNVPYFIVKESENMRKEQKEKILKLIRTHYQAHNELGEMIREKKIVEGMNLLKLCQESAMKIGSLIENVENVKIIEALEGYCGLIYQIYESLGQIQCSDFQKLYSRLNKIILTIENSIENEIKVRIEAVFLPYKAAMWDSLESVWEAASADDGCDAYVIPIPYYDKNPDGSVREEHYEGHLYPAYVPITRYDEFDFGVHRPDIIFIHNPYDEYNYVTSVHPFFYSANLKKYTDKLIYIPYFILEDISPDNQEVVKSIEHFCTVPGVFNADKVIVQSENMRQIYVETLTKFSGEGSKKKWEEKVLGIGSPKIDKVLNVTKEEFDLPEEWMKMIMKPNKLWKKVIFYNTGIVTLLQNDKILLEKIKNVFRVFKENQNDVTLLWRPHPLIRSTIESMRPGLWEEYKELVEQYRKEGWGIYDDSSDIERAIVISDAYYGDMSSVVWLCTYVKKPVMIQDV